MDEKTVVATPPQQHREPSKKQPKIGRPPEKPPLPRPPRKRLGVFTITLALAALLLVGFGSALSVIYFFSGDAPQDGQFTEQELSAELVPVEDADSEAEDEALIKAAISPRIINLSGDPLIVRQLSSAPRQVLKLDHEAQKKAASDLGFTSDVFRIKDVLDTPNLGLQAGLAGSQDDINNLETFDPVPTEDKSIGFSTVETGDAAPGPQIREFAQKVQAKSGLAQALDGFGVNAQLATNAEAAFSKYYGRAQVEPGNRLALRAIEDPADRGKLIPVQVSVYAGEVLVGTIALDDVDHFVQAADPWAGQDIFSTQLLPQDIQDEDRPRLLDAIYAAALRNRLPASITGEAIMLLSRAQDLEQKTQTGDTITIVYSPSARDAKSGLGRIVYIGIGRTTGNLDCYAFQAQAGAKFDCVSANGQSDIPANGMVQPVNGTIAAKFGPQPNASGAAADNMNFGVDWNAPEGSPVMAAYDGDVQSVGPEGAFGLVLRLTHANNKATMYAYLQRTEPGLAAGSKVSAGQVIGYVGTPQSSRAPRLHFELRENDVPVDPLPEAQASVGGGGAGGGVVDQFVYRIITIESANRCNARNPLSTAVGLGQFIESTWMTTVRIHRPDLLAGRSRQQVLDMRLDCNLSRAMTTAFTRDNAAVLSRSGVSVTPGNLYLAHFLGVGGAVKALAGSPSRLISDVFGGAHVRANPFEAGKSVGFLASWAAHKMGAAAAPKSATAAAGQGGMAPQGAATTPAPDAAMVRYDANPAFEKFKQAVVALLQ